MEEKIRTKALVDISKEDGVSELFCLGGANELPGAKGSLARAGGGTNKRNVWNLTIK